MPVPVAIAPRRAPAPSYTQGRESRLIRVLLYVDCVVVGVFVVVVVFVVGRLAAVAAAHSKQPRLGSILGHFGCAATLRIHFRTLRLRSHAQGLF